CERQQGNQWRQHKEYGTHSHYGNRHLNHGIGAAIQETLQLVHIVVHGGDQLPGAGGFKEANVQALGVFVGVLPEVGLQALGQVAPEDLEQVFEDGFAGPDEEGEHRQDGDLLLCGLKAQAGNEAFLLVHHDVNGNTNENLRSNVEELVDDRTGSGCNDLP